jgi:hypothetical protein
MSVGCGMVAVSLALNACNITNAVFATPPVDEQVMFEACRGPLFSIN